MVLLLAAVIWLKKRAVSDFGVIDYLWDFDAQFDCFFDDDFDHFPSDDDDFLVAPFGVNLTDEFVDHVFEDCEEVGDPLRELLLHGLGGVE